MTFVPSPRFVDFIANHHSVRPHIQGGDYRLYSAPVVENPANVVLANGTGVVIFEGLSGGLYEGHIMCLEGHRGVEALELVAQGLQAVFRRPTASIVVAFAPLVLPAVGVLCRRAGFRSEGRDLFHERFAHNGESLWAVL